MLLNEATYLWIAYLTNHHNRLTKDLYLSKWLRSSQCEADLLSISEPFLVLPKSHGNCLNWFCYRRIVWASLNIAAMSKCLHKNVTVYPLKLSALYRKGVSPNRNGFTVFILPCAMHGSMVEIVCTILESHALPPNLAARRCSAVFNFSCSNISSFRRKALVRY